MRFYALDLIRFSAALAVVLYHYTSVEASDTFPNISTVTQYGYLGVPLFFIISGFVISLSAHSRTPTEFAISRFVRLYPALWLGVTVTTIFAITYGGEVGIIQYLANLTILNDYLGYDNIDGVYWTLQAELKFYALVFLLLLTGTFEKFRIWMGIWMFTTITFLLYQQPFFMGWIISPYYSSLFIAGVSFYMMWKNGRDWFNTSVLFLSLIVSSIYTFNQAGGFMQSPDNATKLTAVLLVWCFYIIFLLLILGKLNFNRRPSLIIMGGLTYPLYLIHSRVGKTLINYYEEYLPEEILVVLVILLMMLISLVIHLYFEKKLSTPLKLFLLTRLSRKAATNNKLKT